MRFLGFRSAATAPEVEPRSPWDSAAAIRLFARRLSDGILAGQYRSIFRGSGQEVEELREYVEGDDPRTIDAGVSARLGRPFVKRFVDERQTTLLFVLDRSRSMQVGAGLSLYQGAVLAMAALGRAAAEHHDRLGLILLASQGARVLPPATGSRAFPRLIDAALAEPPVESSADWAAGLERALRLLHRRALVVLLSDFLEGLPGLGERDSARGVLGELARRHELIALRFSPLEHRRWPALGTLRVQDPESGRSVHLDRAAGQAFVREQRARQQAFAHQARSAHLEVFDVELGQADDPRAVSRALLALCAARRARRSSR